HKMILKEARVGGAWAWHQDYGYWYRDGCLFPELASCMVAVDPATRANGCLQVLRGSHHLGRLDHGPVGDQTGADPERVGQALARLERVYLELGPGAARFFARALLLHPTPPPPPTHTPRRPPARRFSPPPPPPPQQPVQGAPPPPLLAAGGVARREGQGGGAPAAPAAAGLPAAASQYQAWAA